MSDAPEDARHNNAEDDAETLSADQLMADIARPTIGRMLLISLGIHAAVLLLTSVGFLSLCVQHNTLDPRSVLKAIEQEKREQELAAKREAARKKMLAERSKKPAEKPEAGKAPPEGQDQPEAGSDKKPKVLKEIEAKSGERPKQSDLKLDELE